MSEREDFYDAEIAPVLLDLVKKCKGRGLSLAAMVEWEPGEGGTTVTLTDDHGWLIEAAAITMRSQRNVDTIIRYLVDVGRKDGHSSIYLSVLEGTRT